MYTKACFRREARKRETTPEPEHTAEPEHTDDFQDAKENFEDEEINQTTFNEKEANVYKNQKRVIDCVQLTNTKEHPIRGGTPSSKDGTEVWAQTSHNSEDKDKKAGINNR